MKRAWIGVAIVLAIVVLALLLRKHEPPLVAVVRVKRETLVSTLPTNGKIEPIEWEAVRAEAAGVVREVNVRDGQTVAGAVIARISQPGLQQDLAGAEARTSESRSALSTLQGGGNTSQISDLNAELARAEFDRDTARRDYESLSRLADKQAATRVEVMAAKKRLDAAEIAIQTTKARLAALVGSNDVAAGRARLAEAESAANNTRQRLALGVVRTPIAGTVYSLPVRPGTYVNVGDLIANVGNLDRLRVKVFVDEPELGRIRIGMPVRITWDGLPGRVWEGTVERLPTEIVPLNARQVGEVWVTISNTGRDLVPGTTVNAEIQTNVATDALVIPKAAIRHDRNPPGVFVLRDNRVFWQTLVTGPSDITNTTVLRGLREKELVILPSDQPLKTGDRARPSYQ